MSFIYLFSYLFIYLFVYLFVCFDSPMEDAYRSCGRKSLLMLTKLEVINYFSYNEKVAKVFYIFLIDCYICKKSCNFIEKGTLTQVFSCEFCEISKNTFFIEYCLYCLKYEYEIIDIRVVKVNGTNSDFVAFTEAERLFFGIYNYIGKKNRR